MPTLSLTAEQLAVLRAGWAYFSEQEDHLDIMAESLKIDDVERGKEDENGNDKEDYDEDDDPVAKRVDEMTQLLGNVAE